MERTYIYCQKPTGLLFIIPATLFVWGTFRADGILIGIVFVFFALLCLLGFAASVDMIIRSRGNRHIALSDSRLTMPDYWHKGRFEVLYRDIIRLDKNADSIFVTVKQHELLNADEPGYEAGELQYHIDRRKMRNRREFDEIFCLLNDIAKTN